MLDKVQSGSGIMLHGLERLQLGGLEFDRKAWLDKPGSHTGVEKHPLDLLESKRVTTYTTVNGAQVPRVNCRSPN